jgi:Tfp pilus assembly protein PilN
LNLAGLSIEGNRVNASFVQGKLGLSTKQLGQDSVDLPLHVADRTTTLREALERWRDGFHIKGVVLGLDLSSFSYHFIDLPLTSKADMAGALAFELEKYLPLSPDEYQYDFHYLGASPGGEGSRVLVLAARKDKLRWIEQAVMESGLKFYAVRCSDIEVMNELLKSKSLRDVVLVTQSDNTFHVMGVEKKGPTLLKTISSAESLQREVSQLENTYIDGVFTSGVTDPAALEGISLTRLDFSAPLLVARSTMKRHAVDMNFLSDQLKPRKVDYYTYGVAALAGLAILLFFTTSLLAYYKDRSTLSEVTDRINEIKSTSSRLVETKRETEAINAQLSFLHSFQLERNRHIAILNAVSTTLPKDAWLTNFLSDEKDTVEIEGYAKRSAAIIAPFENSEMFSDVEFTCPVTVRKGKERFCIKMKVVK